VSRNPEMMTIGQLAKKLGKTPRALRLYEERGLIEPRKRSEGGYRLYGPEAEQRLSWINQLIELGLPLTEIQGVLDTVSQATTPDDAISAVRARFTDDLDALDGQIRRLQDLRICLRESLDYLERCHECGRGGPFAVCQSCRASREEPVPELIAGMLSTPDRAAS